MSPPGRVCRVVVVVPAHDEERLLPACLRSVARAGRACPVPVEVILVADSCRDATVQAARAVSSRADLVLEVAFANVGLARDAGVRNAIGRLGVDGLLVLCTDADSTVPRNWIARHVRHIEAGADLVVGTVRPAGWRQWPRRVAREYRRRYRSDIGRGAHDHVHGANLGVLAARYVELGGFAGLATGEDVHLVQAAARAGRCVLFATDLAVTTSTRRDGRAPEGFSAHLQSLTGTDRTG